MSTVTILCVGLSHFLTKYNALMLLCILVTYMYGLNLWLQRLYKLGARRVLVTGTGPMGCVPAERAMRSRNGECAAELQQASALFNPQLVQMLQGLNKKFHADVFIVANTHKMHMDFITNPQAFGTLVSIFVNIY